MTQPISTAKRAARLSYAFMHLGIERIERLLEDWRTKDEEHFLLSLEDELQCERHELSMIFPGNWIWSPQIIVDMLGLQRRWYYHEVVDETGERP